jgi:DNA-binding GntR family transcriptional regulator
VITVQEDSGFSAERVAEALRRAVLEGELGADDRIKDPDVMKRFGVARSTAREALRLIASEGLVVLRMHTGAAVRRLEFDDVRDIFRIRRTLEHSAVMGSSRAPQQLLDAVSDAVDVAEAHVAEQRWHQALTASLDFHGAIVALLESDRMARFFGQQLAQLRVAFWALPMETDVQAQWVSRDREIAELLVGGRREAAAALLARYLDDSENHVIDAFRAMERPPVSARNPAR